MRDETSQRHLVKRYFEKTRSVCAFSLYPDISDRKAYEGLSQELRDNLIEEGKRALEKPWSQILLSDYLEFSRNGNRSHFEELYFSRRHKLNALIMAELVQNKGEFLGAILDGLYLIMEESSWCLPAHNTHVRDAKQQEYPDTEKPIIDLFDAETGALVAFAEFLLRPVLSEKSSMISDHINRILQERIFVPYRSEHFWWMGDGRQPMCNWTPWCTQNVLLCAITRPKGFFSEEEIRFFLENAALSLDFFLDEYGDDGCCSEGAQYYSHAGLCLFGSLYLMQSVIADREFDGIFREELIRNMADYIVRMNVRDNVYVNFADCAAVCPRRTSREFLFGKACDSKVLSSFAAADFRNGSLADKLLSEEINLFYHVIQAFNYDEMVQYPLSGELPRDSYFDSTGLMITRDENFLLAAKAGNNADSHNHNDVGSFTVYKDGKPLFIDLGVGTYTRETFSDKRYEIWTMQSAFHNVPTFNYGDKAVMQKDGESFCASAVSCCLEDEEHVPGRICSLLTMDIAGAYDDAGVKNYNRQISFIKGSGIELEDMYEGEPTALLTFMTYEKPEVSTGAVDGAITVRIGNLGIMEIEGAESARVESCPIEDERLMISWKHEVYRLLVTMDDGHRLKAVIR